jgi:hypothetical protein
MIRFVFDRFCVVVVRVDFFLSLVPTARCFFVFHIVIVWFLLTYAWITHVI